MLLATDQFDAIVAALHPASASIPADAINGGGQRRSPRVPVLTRVTLVPFAAGAEGLAGYDFPIDRTGSLRMPLADPVSVPIRDLSSGGIRFMMPHRLALDSAFVLLLPGVNSEPVLPQAAGQSLMAVECTVTYWQPIRRDLFAIGAQFLRTLAPFRASDKPATVLLPDLNDASARGDTAPRLAI